MDKCTSSVDLSEKMQVAFKNSVKHFLYLDFFFRNVGNATADQTKGLALQVFCLSRTNVRCVEENPVTDRK